MSSLEHVPPCSGESVTLEDSGNTDKSWVLSLALPQGANLIELSRVSTFVSALGRASCSMLLCCRPLCFTGRTPMGHFFTCVSYCQKSDLLYLEALSSKMTQL